MREINSLIVHHSASRRTTSTHEIDGWHRARGWDQIGYHNLIRLSSELLSVEIGGGRPEQVQGAHCKGRNEGTLGLCLIGNFDEGPVPFAMWSAAVDVLASWCIIHTLHPFDDILGHHEAAIHGPTACPGRFVDMDEMRFAVDRRIFEMRRYQVRLDLAP